MSLIFPLYGEETFIVSWNNEKLLNFEASFEDKILKDKNKVDPEKLHAFLKKWAMLIVEISQQKLERKFKLEDSVFNWESNRKTLSASSSVLGNDKIKLEFKNLKSENYFGRYDVFMQSKGQKNIKLELIVRKCLESAE